MTTQESRLQITEDGDVTRVQFLDRNILEEAAIQQIGQQLVRLIEQSPNPKLLISFENVEHLSSAALGALITINNKSRQKGGQLRLAAIERQIFEVFKITKLDQMFQIFDTADEAMKSFK